MCAEPMLPETVAGALGEYGRLLAEHGITWGEPEIHYVKFFARRRVLPRALFDTFWKLVFEEVARRHPGEPADRLAARLAEPDYDRVLRDTLDGELPPHLATLRIGPDGIELRGAPRTVLLPARGTRWVGEIPVIPCTGPVRGRSELTARAFADAVRAGRTFATTDPWLELSVDGHGPGHVIDARPGDHVHVTASAIGPEVAVVRIRTAEGVRAGAERLPGDERQPDGEERLTVTAALRVDGPTYVVAEVLCHPHARTMTTTGYALTSPVYVDVAGRQVARRDDVRWCLEWLDLLEELIRAHARLTGPAQLADHVALLDRARGVYRARLG